MMGRAPYIHQSEPLSPPLRQEGPLELEQLEEDPLFLGLCDLKQVT